MAGNRVELIFAGDDQQLQKTFDRVGDGAKGMADDVGKASKKMADDVGSGSAGIAGAVDASEGKFRGFGDIVGGTGDIMQGFKEGNMAGVAMGFADLAGGMSALVIPALTALKTTIMTQVGPAMTFLSAHPLFAAIAIGGVIIGALILLEKKFGVVSGALGVLRDALESVWGWLGRVGQAIGGAFATGIGVARNMINGLIGLIERGLNIVLTPYRSASGFLNRIPGVGSAVPDFLTRNISLPRLHTGGIVPGPAGMETLAVLQAGERVSARGAGGPGGVTIIVQGSVITERDLGRVVADAIRNNRLLGVTV